MRAKEEVEAVIAALAKRLNGTNSDFTRGVIYGAVDALAWALEEEYSATSVFFVNCAKQEFKPTARARPKKQAIVTDHFAI